jgi:hypothetical protein
MPSLGFAMKIQFEVQKYNETINKNSEMFSASCLQVSGVQVLSARSGCSSRAKEVIFVMLKKSAFEE